MMLPHFTVRDHEGRTVAYRDLWQRRNVLLIVVDSAESARYVSELKSRMDDLTAHETTCVITRDSVEGLRAPAAAIADRWGEIQKLIEVDHAARLPAVDELVEWLRYVQMQCPECQGEAR